MQYREFITRECLYFSRWSNKGYSIFVGLGHEVLIGHLTVDMFDSVLLKSAPKGVIVNTDRTAGEVAPVVLAEVLRPVAVNCKGEVRPDRNNKSDKTGKGYIGVGQYVPF